VPHDLTFFSIVDRNKELKVGDKHRRQLLITLLESNEALSKRQLNNYTDASFGFVYDTIDSFVKAGYVKPLVVANHKARKDSKYELTEAGKLIALAIAVDQNRVIGDRTAELQKIFQPQQGFDDLTHFIHGVLLHSVTNGLQRWVLEFIRDVIKEAEVSSEPNLWKIARDGFTAVKPSEAESLRKSVLQALNSLSDSEKDTVIQYYRNMVIEKMFTDSMKSHNSRLQTLAKESQRDSEGVYFIFQCTKCGYQDEHMYMKMDDVIVEVFTRGKICPKCNRLILDSKKSQKQIVKNPKLYSR
jgi:DNA-binding PadR family transcriptional regulator